MNMKALKATRALLKRRGQDSYDQQVWGHRCGTPACIAGFAVVAAGWDIEPARKPRDSMAFYCQRNGTRRSIQDVATEALGLTEYEREILFDDNGGPRLEDAIATLDHAIEYGAIQWQRAVDS